MSKRELKGWNYIIYILIKNNFKYEEFTLNELYNFEPYFKSVYPENFHIKDKLRQVLQFLRNKGLLEFISKGKYQLLLKEELKETLFPKEEVVYLLSNESIPD